MSIYAVVFPQYIRMNNQPTTTATSCVAISARVLSNAQIITRISRLRLKKGPQPCFPEKQLGGPVTPQVLSAQCDRRNVLITLIAAVCLQYLWTMRISSYNGLLSKYVHGEDNGQTTYGQRSATNACLAVNAGEQ